MTPEIMQQRLIDFGHAASDYACRLRRSSVTRALGQQLGDSCMSPIGNYGEAQKAESKRDFNHKMQVCLKELSETLAWLRAAQKRDPQNPDLLRLIQECNELVAMFTRSVRTGKSRPDLRKRRKRRGVE